MTPNEYQELAARTRCPQNTVLARLDSLPFRQEQRKKFPDASGVFPPEHCGAILLHGVVGLTGEVGELAGAVEKYAWYKQDFDRRNVIEEVGDCFWYLAEILDALDMSMEQVMEMNIIKLKKRFPEKFEKVRALEENRDRDNEVSHIESAPDDGPNYGARPETD